MVDRVKVSQLVNIIHDHELLYILDPDDKTTSTGYLKPKHYNNREIDFIHAEHDYDSASLCIELKKEPPI
mgnify:CR=1 FL=1